MFASTNQLLQRIHALMPDLAIEQVERNEEGLINDVLIINQQLVFRFAKNENSVRILESEIKILDLIRPNIGLSVPTPVYRSSDCIVYPLLPGQPLTLKRVSALDEKTQATIAEQVGAFLYRLHTTNISKVDWELPVTRAPVKRENWLDLQARARAKIVPLLQGYQVEWFEDLFAGVLENSSAATYTPALIHGDLASYHFLFDEQAGKLSGVIDFGMAGLGDPASDIGGLINIYGESFVKKMRTVYPTLDDYLPRARFYAQLLELQWTLLGLETGETFWFTAHLGSARDIQS
jgi:aminoglycoside 2''-phosphotransferase